MTLTLVPREVKHVQKTWNMVKQDETRHCAEILIRTFEKYPDILEKFEPFKNLSFAEMRRMPEVQVHVSMITRYLGAIIAVIEEPHLMVQTTYMLGAVHKQRRATKHDFQRFQEVMVAYLRESFGSSLPEAAFQAFDKLLDEFVDQVSPHLIG